MIALHGIWWKSRLHVWRERGDSADSARPPAAPIQAEKLASAPSSPLVHPNALPSAELQVVIGEVSRDGLLASVAAESSLALWLPCVGTVPVLLPAASETPSPEESAAFRLVSVPTLAFSPADAVDFLTSLSRTGPHCDSDSIRFWSGLARLVFSLLARQQFAPSVEQQPDGAFLAQWQPYIHDRTELTWLEKYAAAMPPVCRAVAATDPSETDAARLVDEFVVEATDAVARRYLENDPFFQQIHARAARQQHWEVRWLSALLGEKRTVRASVDDNTAYAAQVRSWIEQLEETSAGAASLLCFTLVEPEDDAVPAHARWRVRFDLHSADDGMPLDISKVWTEPQKAPMVLGHHLLTRRQHLRAELARAAEVFYDLKKVLRRGAPTGILLSTTEAHLFMRQYAPLLQAQGFKVILPDWVRESNRRLGLQLFLDPVDDLSAQSTTADNAALRSLGLDALLEFDWRIAVGDKTLSLGEFEQIAQSEAPLVRLHGQWLELDPAAAAKALRFMRSRPRGRMTLLEALRVVSGADEQDTGLPIVGLAGTSWVDRLLSETPEVHMEMLEQPPAFVGALRPYQRRGLEWLAFLDRLGIGACLADDMGLGKTIQLIALLLHERRDGQSVDPTLLFAPMSVVGNWEREVRRFAPSLRILVHHGPLRLAGDGFVEAATRHDLVVTTYGLAQRDFEDFSRIRWRRLALDEAQKIKNPSAHQTIAVRALRSARRVALTGTPVENHLSELWSIMEMLNAGLLGSAAAFRKRFAVPVEKIGDQERAAQLRRLIRPFVLRRLKSDPAVECDLPEKMEMRVYCNLTPEQAAHYERLVAELLEEVDSADGIRRRGLILTTLTRLKQTCNHPEHLLRGTGPLEGRSGKCERLVEMIEEVLDEGDAALVFTQYREMGHLLERLLREKFQTDIPFMHGGTPAKRRDEMVDGFQDPAGKTRLFILSLKTGGFGLNLTKANHVFHFDRWWNPAVENQATDRAHRIGQTRRVQVHKFVCIGTIEDRIDQILAEKSALADQIVGSGDEWLTGLSTSELREYLALSPEAVAES